MGPKKDIKIKPTTGRPELGAKSSPKRSNNAKKRSEKIITVNVIGVILITLRSCSYTNCYQLRD